ncbi:MAG: hypothetical protein ABIS20_13490 [Thermoanaerobaculia bacterium]
MSWLPPLTLFLPLLAYLPGGRWALPLIAPLTLWPAFRERVRTRDYLGAWTLGVVWACVLSAGVILLTLWAPEAARGGILHGEDYRREMFGWISTGVAPENDPRAFIPQHLLHLGVFILLTWASGGYLGLALGALLVAYMSYFVGCYAAASGHPLLGSFAAWVPLVGGAGVRLRAARGAVLAAAAGAPGLAVRALGAAADGARPGRDRDRPAGQVALRAQLRDLPAADGGRDRPRRSLA